MFIIFDLDDTLIDTTNYIVPFQLSRCLRFLQKQQLILQDESKALVDLMQLRSRLHSSKKALECFLQDFSLDISVKKKVFSFLTQRLPKDFLVPLFPFAKEVLTFFSLSHTLVLVTAGNAAFQKEKLEKAGLDPAVFSKICISRREDKGKFYKEVLKIFSCREGEVWVCGDHIEYDLWPAHLLGMRTVHVCHHKDKARVTPAWVDCTACELDQLKEMIL